jgi:IS605 OrfB family transposase
MKKKIANELSLVQELAEHNQITVSVKMSDKYMWLTYDETLIRDERYKKLQSRRLLGIDMNPNFIGLSVIEFDKNDEFNVLHKRVFDLSKLTISSEKSSTDSRSKYLTNKLKHETIAIAHEISKLVDVWKCKTVAIEDLSIKPKDLKKGKKLNRLCNNKWERRLFVNKLKMLANLHKYELVEVNPAYSSIVGNFAYGSDSTPDMVAASIEIARRAYKKFEKRWFYPRFNIQFRDEQWKQTLGSVENWKELSQKIKESKLKYRFQLLDYIQNAVFSKNYIQKCYSIYTFA